MKTGAMAGQEDLDLWDEILNEAAHVVSVLPVFRLGTGSVATFKHGLIQRLFQTCRGFKHISGAAVLACV